MTAIAAPPVAPDDPYLWLEDVAGDQALAWVRERNRRAEDEFAADPRYEPLRRAVLDVLDSKEKIPYVSRMGGYYYNLWKDAANPRGLWRRTPVAEYRRAASHATRWETVIDIDALAKRENENWVFGGAECFRPKNPDAAYRRCIIALSRGGADATVLREFDLIRKHFVPGGFNLPEAKQYAVWKDADTLWIGSDFGAGSMTRSGYPRVVKEWKRGSKLASAATIFEGQADDVGVWSFTERESGTQREWINRSIAFWNEEYYVRLKDRSSRKQKLDQPIKLDLPHDAQPSAFRDWLLVRTRTPWTTSGKTYAGGALLAIKFDAFVGGARNFEVLYEPRERSTLVTVAQTRNAVLLTELDNVRARLWELTPERRTGSGWHRARVAAPDNAQVDIATTYWADDEYLYTLQDFTTPTTLHARRAGTTPAEHEALRSLPRFFDSEGLVTRQFEATSRDGTRVPYFIVMRQEAKLDRSNPTLIYGYGGFEHSELPWYSGTFGKGWLEPGGVFVLANLRGGGEFGPQWHRAAQKENKQRTWDDLAAVAEDLIARGVTSPRHLGIMGGSQGGLLVTTTLLQRPELFGAAVAQVPLTDMLRYHKLLAGASWIAEYGDPDKAEERSYLERYSPYQNVKKEIKYPPLFLVTSTRDDRVHPAHARKLAARMSEQGHDVLYFENIEGGHGGAADNPQIARMWAQAFRYLWNRTGPAPSR